MGVMRPDGESEQHGRPTGAVVDVAKITANAAYFKRLLSPSQQLMAVVKADGYGHGGIETAKAAMRGGATWLGVALAEEGIELRKAGISVPILVLGPSHPAQIALAVAHEMDVTIFDWSQIAWAKAAVLTHQKPCRVHLKLDTGMGRIGLPPEQLNEAWVETLKGPDFNWVGLSTHFASSDRNDPEPTKKQLLRFLDAIEWLRGQDALPVQIHAANSAATLRYPGTHLTMVRVGLALYGLKPYPAATKIQAAMSWHSEVVYVKSVPAGFRVGYGATYVTSEPTKLVSVPVGYADGYRRAWSNRSDVLIRGRRHRVVGNISMDQITVAVRDQDPVAVGDQVTLLGCDGDEEISAEELAALMDSIAYEVVTGISKRVPRSYLGD